VKRGYGSKQSAVSIFLLRRLAGHGIGLERLGCLPGSFSRDYGTRDWSARKSGDFADT